MCCADRSASDGAAYEAPLWLHAVNAPDGRRYEIQRAATVGNLFTKFCVPKGIRKHENSRAPAELGSIRDRADEPTVTQSDGKCMIAHEPVAERDSVQIDSGRELEAPTSNGYKLPGPAPTHLMTGHKIDAVAAALADALALAAAAGRWDVVAELGRVLTERQRLTVAPGVASLDAERERRRQ